MNPRELHQRNHVWRQATIRARSRLYVGLCVAIAMSSLSGYGLLSGGENTDVTSEETLSGDVEMLLGSLDVSDRAPTAYPVTGTYSRRSHPQSGKVLVRRIHERGGEGSVLCALRWLKLQQKPDGSWPGEPTSMTGLALLAFLGHGDTPNPDCVEFGLSVEKAIRYLVENQNEDGTFKSKDPENYAHPIATFALCEAYILTKVPMLKVAAEKALAPIVRSQNPSGGWDLNLKPSGVNNTSYMGWCAQALRAAHMAGDLEVEGLDVTYQKAVNGLKANVHPMEQT